MSATPPRRRRGRALDRDDAGREQAATVGPEDADSAAAWWDRFAPAEARGLLDAEEEEPDDERDDE